jgi:hypothetical protein
MPGDLQYIIVKMFTWIDKTTYRREYILLYFTLLYFTLPSENLPEDVDNPLEQLSGLLDDCRIIDRKTAESGQEDSRIGGTGRQQTNNTGE